MTTFLALIAFLLPTYLVRFEIAGIPTTMLEVLIYVVTFVGIVRFAAEPTARQRLDERRLWLLPAGLILLGGLVGTFVSPDLRTAPGLFKGFIVDPILVYCLTIAFSRNADDGVRIARGAFWGGVVVGLWALIDRSSVGEFGRSLGPYALDPNASPNYLAFATAPLLPLAVWLVAGRHQASGIRHQMLYGLGALILILALVASQSRAGIAAGLGGLILAWILSREALWCSKLQQRFVVVALLISLALSWFVVRPNPSLSQEFGGRVTASNNVRFQIWSVTGELMRSHWLTGVGLGNFQPAFAELTAQRVNYPEFISPLARTPHNLLVGVWSELGLIGLIGLISVPVLVGKALFRALRRGSGRPAAAALAGAWFVLIAHGLVDMPIWKNDTMILWWILVALAATLELNPTRVNS